MPIDPARFTVDYQGAVADLEKGVLMIHDALVDRLEKVLPERSPVLTGEFAGAWQRAPEKAASGGGKRTRITNKAPHAFAIDRGRRPGLYGKTRGKRIGRRWLGSKDAPAGVSEPAADQVTLEAEAIVERLMGDR